MTHDVESEDVDLVLAATVTYHNGKLEVGTLDNRVEAGAESRLAQASAVVAQTTRQLDMPTYWIDYLLDSPREFRARNGSF